MITREESQIRSIAARAAPLWERPTRAAVTTASPDLKLAERRLERWQQILGDKDLLNRRLLSSSLAVASLEGVLGQAEDTAQGAVPPWAAALESILSFYSAPTPIEETRDKGDGSYEPTRPLPFQDVFSGFIQYARQEIKTEGGSALEVLSPSALKDLEQQLLAHLTFVANLAVGRAFYEFRFERAPASAIESVWQQQKRSTEIYWAYVRHMYEGGLIKLLNEHPVLARLLCQSVEQWVKASIHFCQRFKEDFPDLRALFGWTIEQPEGAVARLRTDLSDRHRGGQTVADCILRTGERVIYKPRTVKPELAFYGFIDWLNQQGLPCDLKVLRALDRATHGWVEPVAFTPCCTHAEVENFYRRTGMLLGVLHVLGVTDVHRENLIACGEHPVVVDLETLLSEGWQVSQGPSQEAPGDDNLNAEPSVLSTGLLPRWQTSQDGRQFDMSALGADGTQDPDIRVQAWQSINTDQMMLSGDTKFEAPLNHRVRLDGKLPSAADHLPVFLEGFKQVYDCLLKNREQLLSDGRLLTSFDNLDLRILVRSTSTYTRIHLHLLHPEFLRDGIDRSIEIEWLARPLSGTPEPSEGRKLLYELERAAMENLDIPHFSTLTWSNLEQKPGDEDLAFLYKKRDSRVIERRLASLSPNDFIRQVAIIEKAVRWRFVNERN